MPIIVWSLLKIELLNYYQTTPGVIAGCSDTSPPTLTASPKVAMPIIMHSLTHCSSYIFLVFPGAITCRIRRHVTTNSVSRNTMSCISMYGVDMTYIIHDLFPIESPHLFVFFAASFALHS